MNFSTSQLEAEVFCTFWLRNVLRATTACNFSSLICPAGSAPAALASLLFDPLEPQIIGKTQCFDMFRDFPTFSGTWIFFLLRLSLLLFSLLIFSLLSASAPLCFPSVHIVGSLTSKLPSKNIYIKMPRGLEDSFTLKIGYVQGLCLFGEGICLAASLSPGSL